MSLKKESLGDRFYRGLLRILPFDFRSEFGDEMEETFREQHAATVRRSGRGGVFRMWWATIRDIVTMAPREHATERIVQPWSGSVGPLGSAPRASKSRAAGSVSPAMRLRAT